MNDIDKFVAAHRADDIVYALRCPEYFSLTPEQHTALHTLVFGLLNAYKTTLEDVDY